MGNDLLTTQLNAYWFKNNRDVLISFKMFDAVSSSNPNQTHLKQLIKLFSMLENTQAGELKQVGNKLCRTVGPQEQG